MPFILVTGHSRSGTGYMSKLFKHFGYEVGHEAIQKCGLSAFQLAVETRMPVKGIKRTGRQVEVKEGGERFDIDWLIHVVRDPWKVLSSDVDAKGHKWTVECIPEIQGQNEIDQCMRSIVLWNRAVEALNPDLLVKAEEADVKVRKWIEAKDIWITEKGSLPDKKYNSRDCDEIRDIGRAQDETVAMFKEHCVKYGYSPEIAPA